MYFAIAQAREELWKRRRDTALQRQVLDYVGEVPAFFRREPRAVIARPLATPNFELFRFAAGARQAGLLPVCAEYAADRFVSANPDKLRLAKLTFLHGVGRGGGLNTSVHRLFDLREAERRPFLRLQTRDGEGLVEFHHRLLAWALPHLEWTDCSSWLRRLGGSPERFWPRHLALYLCFGILFENFDAEGPEAAFTRKIIEPALARIEERFGLKPLVVALVPGERQRTRVWSWYPGHLEPLLGRPAAKPESGPLKPYPAQSVARTAHVRSVSPP